MSRATTTVWGLTQLGVAAGFALAVGLIAVLEPIGDGVRFRFADEPLRELCEVRAATGAPCEGCGLTRGMVSALQLDFDDARRHNPAATPLLLLALAQIAIRPLLASLALRGRSAVAAGVVDLAVIAGSVFLILP